MYSHLVLDGPNDMYWPDSSRLNPADADCWWAPAWCTNFKRSKQGLIPQNHQSVICHWNLSQKKKNLMTSVCVWMLCFQLERERKETIQVKMVYDVILLFRCKHIIKSCLDCASRFRKTERFYFKVYFEQTKTLQVQVSIKCHLRGHLSLWHLAESFKSWVNRRSVRSSRCIGQKRCLDCEPNAFPHVRKCPLKPPAAPFFTSGTVATEDARDVCRNSEQFAALASKAAGSSRREKYLQHVSAHVLSLVTVTRTPLIKNPSSHTHACKVDHFCVFSAIW